MVRICFLLFTFLSVNAFAQRDTIQQKTIKVKLSEKAPVIDGILNDEAWNAAEVAKDFVQTTPKPGHSATQPAEVRIIYDDEAVYVAARMHEENTDSIYNFLTERDWFGNADWFIIVFNTYRDGLNGEGFAVTPAGVQIDIKYSNDGESNSWDAVWESATSIDDKGWTAEMKIPYSALRFPETDKQLWGINFGRQIRRNRETSWWNRISPLIDGFLTQAGRAEGIENIKPPPRLFFYPYSSAYVEHNSANGGSTNTSFNAGMDIKYGLSDAFTLDMTLVPDFGQARFDNQVLNLTPFEVQFNENRQFFTEGVEIFNKAGLFYSRRIGGFPLKYGSINSQLDSNERVLENPRQAQLINATKISGRNKNGLGIGFFNAVEGEETALIENTESKERRKVETNPLTNYNVLVFDQVLRNNSFVTLTNTNVSRDGNARDANVSQLDFQLADKKNQYAIRGFGGMSHLFDESKTISGSILNAAIEKISGNFTFELSQNNISDKFNPNDLGFLTINNIKESYFFAQFANYGTEKFNFWRHNFDVTYQRVFKPDDFLNFSTSWSTVYNLKSFHAFGLNAGVEPIKTNDYFETRTFEQYYKYPKNFWVGGFISTDYSRPFAFDIRLQSRTFDEAGRNYFFYSLSGRFRPTDKLFFVIGNNRDVRDNDIGFVSNSNDSITFGRRTFTEYESFIDGSYIFNNKMALSLNLRHYWSTAVYDRFYFVNPENGNLDDTDYQGFNEDGTTIHDRSFNAFNIDLGFSWRFAPGSDINVVWKNIILQSGDPLERNYFKELEETISAPQINNFSIKVLYFIDYLWLKKSDK